MPPTTMALNRPCGGNRRLILYSAVLVIWIASHALGAWLGDAEPQPAQTTVPVGDGTSWGSPVESYPGPYWAALPYRPDAPAANLDPARAADFGQSAAGRFDPIRFPVQAGDVFSPLLPWDEQSRAGWRLLRAGDGGDDWYRFDAQVRSFYVHDLRIEWSGLEDTFGVEGAVLPMFRHRCDWCELIVLGELYLNQPFDRNNLVDTPERRSYAGNFAVDTLQVSQLYLAVRRDNLELAFGKMVTPFGRTYFPLFTNGRFDAPLIRSEAIRWRETGLLLRYDPAPLVCDVAVTNGGDERDTNSSKALVSRIAFRAEGWAGGCSIKIQDGVGSEGQKQYNNHLGADLMHRWGMLTLSGEVIYDQYGFRRPGFDPNDITWGRSIYYRDLNKTWHEPITGVGYYVNLGLEKARWMAALSYGEFYPEAIGDPRHDVTIRRGIIKLACEFARRLDAYTALILETGGYLAQENQPRKGTAVLAGIQYAF
jgi:hypothetical protein